ncbi:MAG: Fur family transcriptional regulator, partial [Chloroflexota bacterium]
MSCNAQSASALRSAGHRVTAAKLQVMSVLRHANRHMPASEVIEAAQAESPHMSPSTVYRTLYALRDSRLVSETHLGNGEHMYEWLGEGTHHHTVCSVCGAVGELDDSLVRQFKEAVRRRHGFDSDITHMAVQGMCRGCTGTDRD